MVCSNVLYRLCFTGLLGTAHSSPCTRFLQPIWKGSFRRGMKDEEVRSRFCHWADASYCLLRDFFKFLFVERGRDYGTHRFLLTNRGYPCIITNDFLHVGKMGRTEVPQRRLISLFADADSALMRRIVRRRASQIGIGG
jgi:hypothetical protein